MPESEIGCIFHTGDRVALAVGVLAFLPGGGKYEVDNAGVPQRATQPPTCRMLQPGEEFTFVRHRGEAKGGCAVRDSANLVWFVPTGFLRAEAGR